jgi:hypothetical protein
MHCTARPSAVHGTSHALAWQGVARCSTAHLCLPLGLQQGKGLGLRPGLRRHLLGVPLRGGLHLRVLCLPLKLCLLSLLLVQVHLLVKVRALRSCRAGKQMYADIGCRGLREVMPAW